MLRVTDTWLHNKCLMQLRSSALPSFFWRRDTWRSSRICSGMYVSLRADHALILDSGEERLLAFVEELRRRLRVSAAPSHSLLTHCNNCTL